MRGIILALLLALAGSEKSHNEQLLNPTKTYLYNYEGIIVSGLPDNGLSKAGLKLNFDAEISGFAQRTFILRVQKLDIKEYHGVWPRDPFTRSTRLSQAIAEQFKHPFKFEYHDGRVGDVFAAEGTSITAVNIIRGLVNLLQVHVRKAQNVYQLDEDCISGKCPTRYLIQDDDKKSNSIIVIKSRDLEKCENRAVKRIGMTFLEPCRACQQKSKNLRGMLTSTYRIRNKAQGAVIEEAKAKEVYQYSPFYELYGSVATEVRQLLILKEIKSSRVSEPRVQLENRGGLIYHFGSEVFQMPLHLLKGKNIESQISDTLQRLVQNNQQEVQAEAPAKFLQLIQLLRDTDPDNIQAIFKQYSDRPLYRQWLTKAIPLIGSTESLKVVKRNIPNQSIQEAAMSITLSMHHTRASQSALQIAADLVQDSRVQDSPTLLKAAMLSYGTLVYKYCANIEACPESALQPLHDFAAEAANKARPEEIILALKALGNTGQVACIKRILKFLPGFSSSAFQLPIKVQVDAVMSLRNIAKDDPKRVQEILLSILMNRRVHTEVRMMAFAVLMETRPPAATVTTMALIIQKEAKVNLQLASFAYSYMKSLTKAAVPEFHELNGACNVAIKILSPVLDKLSMRYSKVINFDTFDYPLMSGATAKVLIMNSPTTTMPAFVLFKLRGYVSGATTDIVEIAVRAEGLQEVLRKQNIAFDQYSMQKNIIKIIKSLTGFRSLPSEVPLVSANVKVFGQEVFYNDATKETIQSVFRILTEPTSRHPVIKRMIQKLLDGLVAQWAQPILLAEVRHIVPTSMGLPLELSVYSAAVGNAAVNLDMKANPSPSSDLSVAQLLQSNIQLRADVTPSISVLTVASMGVNTPLVQSGIEFQAKIQAVTPLKSSIRFNPKDQNIKIETQPIQQENDLVTVRTQVFAVSRNVGELEAAKKTPIVPKGAEPNILQKHFEKSEKTSAEGASMMEGSSEITAKKYAYPGETGQHQYTPASMFHLCIKVPKINIHICAQHKARSAAGRKHTRFYQIVGDHEAKLSVKPAQKDLAIEKLLLEITTGPKAASKIIALADLEEKGEHLEESEVHKRLRTILGIDETLAANQTLRARKARKHVREEDDEATQKHGHSTSNQHKPHGHGHRSWEDEPQNGHKHNTKHSSSSSDSDSSSDSSSSHSSNRKDGHNHRQSSSSKSDSSSSSNSDSSSSSSSQQQKDRKHQQPAHQQDQHRQQKSRHYANEDDREIFELRFKRPNEERVRTMSGRIRASQSGSSSSSSSSSSSEYAGRPQARGRFLGEHKSPSLVATLQAVRADHKKQGYQLIVYEDYHSPRPKIQAYVVDITGESRWRACINAQVESQHEAQAELKWGQNCQQYKIAAWAETGRWGSQPALRLKFSWPRIPSKLKSVGQVVSWYVPGAALMLGFAERLQRNPSRQAKLILALSNPRTMNVVFHVPQATLYYQALNLPAAFTAAWHARPADIPIPTWNVFADAHNSIADRLKGRCSLSNNLITTFNDVNYNYTMPGHCYHVLAQDCTEENKFLIMAKKSKENPEHKDLNVKLGEFEIMMDSRSGEPRVKVNNIDISRDRLPYQPSQEPSVTIEERDGRIVLSAPEFGIDELLYDGKSSELRTALWMRGKTCGICGHHDDETEQEFKMPDGSVAKDEESFGHSWILAEEACTGVCKLHRSLVKTEKPEREESKCYSIHPVLRCAKGCTPSATSPVSVGFHCTSADLAEEESLIDRPEDYTEQVEAHTSCSCESLKCAA
ncbi:vitellogenin-A2-like isoform X2 [Dendrobates tinctorius]|uniref:vitellogenin-A2-like isoform X2 n=1 Tax=Dendrobates tinctorius TaxID=92724 RepID=UPI003CCA6A43